ncbi:hypothetical protein RUND412_004893 [Rhizina undulata]
MSTNATEETLRFQQWVVNVTRSHDSAFDASSPPWDDVNYVRANRAMALLVANGILMSLAIIFVAGRCYTRVKIVGSRLGGDDYSIILAVVVLIVYTNLNVYGVHHAGFGKHFYSTGYAQAGHLLKITYALPIIYTVGVTSIKISLLLFYRRLTITGPVMHKVIKWMIATQVLCGVGTIFGLAFICSPLQGWWNLDVQKSITNCPNYSQTTAIYITLRTISVLSDIIILLMPVSMVWKLDLPVKQKLGLAGLFTLGMLACVAAILRLTYLPAFLLGIDVSWTIIPIAMLDQMEQALSIITSCIPALTALISRSKGRLRGNSYDNTSSIELSTKGRSHLPTTDYRNPNFDFLSLAYDPDRTGICYSTAFAYGGNSREIPGRRAEMSVPSESDEHLVVGAMDPGGISKTTTVEVKIDRR